MRITGLLGRGGLVGVVCFGFSFFNLSGAYVEWDSGLTYSIPSDGNIYYLETSVTLTADLTINGSLQVWTDGVLSTSDQAVYNNQTLTVTGGACSLPGGIFYNGHSAGASIEFEGGEFDISGGELRNGISYTTTSTFCVNGGELRLYDGATIVNGYDLGSTGSMTILGGSLFVDGGDISVGSGSEILTIFGASITGSLSSGLFAIPNGQVMTISESSMLEVTSNGQLTNNGSLTNNGVIKFANSFVNNGALTNLGLYYEDWDYDLTYVIPADQLNNKTFYLSDSVTLTSDLTINGSLVLLSNGVLSIGDNVLYNNNTLEVSGGQLSLNGGNLYNGQAGAGVLRVIDGMVYAVGGNLYNGGGSNGLIYISGGQFFCQNVALYNAYSSTGTIRLTSGSLDLSVSSTLYNGEGDTGKIILEGGAVVLANGALYNGKNYASDIELNGGSLILSGGKLYNGGAAAGTIAIQAGSFNLSYGELYNAVDPVSEINLAGGVFVSSGGTLFGTINELGGMLLAS